MTTVRPLRESDLAEADAILHQAFATFLGLPGPADFIPGRDYIHTRFRTDPTGALGVEVNGRLAGSNIVSNWGSYGSFGPLSVLPEFWNQRVAQALLGPTVDLFDRWGVRDAGLFTFVNSLKHIALYQKFGFWPGSVIGIVGKQLLPAAGNATFPADADEAACRELADSLFPGLDPTQQIRAVAAQSLGETVIVRGGDSAPEAFAICHCGEGSEAGPGNCYIKFAAVRPGSGVEGRFERLLNACESMALSRGLDYLEAGIHLDCTGLYRQMLDRGFRLTRTGLAMYRSTERPFSRPGVYVLADWR